MDHGGVRIGLGALGALLMVAVPAAEALAAAPHPMSAPIVGGWSPAPIKAAEVRQAAREAVRQLGRPGARLRRVHAASQQVVAGINYRLDIQLRDGSRWRVTVWRKLDGSHELTDAAPL